MEIAPLFPSSAAMALKALAPWPFTVAGVVFAVALMGYFVHFWGQTMAFLLKKPLLVFSHAFTTILLLHILRYHVFPFAAALFEQTTTLGTSLFTADWVPGTPPSYYILLPLAMLGLSVMFCLGMFWGRYRLTEV